MKKILLAACMALVVGAQAFAQEDFTGTYTFGSNGNVASFAYNGDSIDNLAVGNLTKNGVTTSSSSGNFRASAWTTGSTIDLTDYFEFTLTADEGYLLSMTSITFGIGRSGTGTRYTEWRSSVNGYADTISTYTTVNAGLTNTGGVLQNPDDNSSWTGNILDLSGAAFSDLTTITFRVYFYASEASGGTAGLQGPLSFAGSLAASGGGGDSLYWASGAWTDAEPGTGGNGTWSTGGNWDSSKKAVFAGAAGAVTVDSVTAEAGIQFSTTGYTLSEGTITLAGNSTITTDSGVTTTIGSTLSGSAGMTKAGAGTLVLTGDNDYSGGTTVSAGTLTGTTSSLQGNITNNATVVFDQAVSGTYAGDMSGSGLLTKTGEGNVTLSGTNSYSGGTTVSEGTLTGTTSSLQGNITNNAAVVFDQAGNGTYAGVMSGSGSLTKTGEGNVTLSGTNDYSGGTTVSAGTLTGTTTSLQGAIENNAAVVFDQDNTGTYSGNMSGSGSLTKTGEGNVTMSGTNSYSGGTIVSEGTLTGTTSSLQGSIGNNAAVVFDQSSSGTYAGDMSGSGTLTKTGSGAVTLSGDNSYGGGTSISEGTLVAGSDTAFGSGDVMVTGGSLFAADGVTVGNDLMLMAATGGIIISEYVEGSSNNKYIEIFNGTTSAIDLNEYRLALYTNGSSTAGSTQILSGLSGGPATLGAGLTLVLRNSGAALTLPSGVVSYTSGVANFNGDDAIALQLIDGTNIDIFGVIGNDPGTAWTAGSLSTLDQTLVRNADVTSGVSVNPTGTGVNAFTTLGTEWTGFAIDTVSNLGSHTMNAGSAVVGVDEVGASVEFSGAVTITGTVEFTAASEGSASFTNTISGAGAVAKTGEGEVLLSGENTYSGGTTITEGTLVAANESALGTGTVSVEGGTLATTVVNVNTGNVNMSEGAFSLNGASTGTLTLSTGADMVWTGGLWNLSITSLASFDHILGGGAGSEFAISDVVLNLSGAIAEGTYAILTGFTNGTASFSEITGAAGYDTQTSVTDGVLTLTISLTVIPEPHEYAMMIAGFLGLLIVVRRMRQRANEVA